MRNSCTLDFIKKARKVHGDKYEYNEVHIEKKTDWATITCKKHGNFKQRASSHQQGFGCPACGKESMRATKLGQLSSKKFTESKILARIHKLHPNYDTSKVVYVDLGTPIKLRCKIHDHKFKQKPFNVIYTKGSGKGCKFCRSEGITKALALTKKEYQERITQRFGPDIKVLKYTGMHSPVTLLCSKHGRFEANNGQNFSVEGRGCPKCNPVYSSYPEILLERQFPEALRHDRSLGFELDFYWPDTKLAVEVNGVYWHSTLYKTKYSHYDKMVKAKKHGITLLQFWDYEVTNHTSLVTSMIRSKLGDSKFSIGARQLDCKILKDPLVVNTFFLSNHLQGTCSYTHAVGLFDKKKLVGCATFGKPRWNKEYEYELLRLAFRQNYSVPGGASKLLHFFEKTIRPISLVSYANRRFSIGNLYEALGFKKLHRTKPNYQWFFKGRLLSRYQTQKHRLKALLPKFDSSKSESRNMLSAGAFQIYDCGNLVYGKVYNKKAFARN